MTDRQWLIGPEVDWLESQIQAVLWRPGGRGVTEAVRPTSRPASVHSPQKKASASQSLVDFMREQQLARQQAQQASVAPLSVEEYNRQRGANPRMAATMPYVYQEYPKILYRATPAPDGKARLKVANATEHESAVRAGWLEADIFFKGWSA